MEQQAHSGIRKSQALQALEKKYAHITGLMEFIQRQHGHVFVPMWDAANKLKNLKGISQRPMAELQAALAEVEHFVRMLTFLNDWMLVMLVSFAEAYLSDVLTLVVEHNPEWMNNLKLKISYAELTGSPMETMQRRWQSCWVSSILQEKPQKWIATLEALGATGYRAGLPAEIATVWQRRHSIVHSGEASHMSASEFLKVLDVISNFLQPTDAFVVAFLNAHPLS